MTKRRTPRLALVAAVTAFFMAFAGIALADNFQNDVTVGGNDTITAGGSTTITYRLVGNNSPSGDISGCNVDADNPATVNIAVDAAVTKSVNSFQFTACGNGGEKTVTYGSSTAGNYLVNVTISGGKIGALYNDQADFTLKVNAATSSDTTPPTVDCTVPNQSIWHGNNVTVNCTAEDTGSGLADANDASFSLSTTVASGVANASAATDSKTVLDNEGNSTTVGPYTFMVDRENPTASFSNCPTSPLLLGSTASANWTASDGSGSGLATAASGSVTLNTSSVGSKSASSPAPVDNVGNTGSAAVCNYSVIYNWDGFFRPVDNGMLNSVKAGSAVPVKFSLSGDQGLNIFAAGSPTSQKIVCDTSEGIDAIDETVTAGSSSLSYDATADQYIYVWKTNKTWAGTCRMLTVTLNDGTVHTASFKLLK